MMMKMMMFLSVEEKAFLMILLLPKIFIIGLK